MMDDLTGVWNRSGLNSILKREFAQSAVSGLPISVAMLDIDHFKKKSMTFTATMLGIWRSRRWHEGFAPLLVRSIQ